MVSLQQLDFSSLSDDNYEAAPSEFIVAFHRRSSTAISFSKKLSEFSLIEQHEHTEQKWKNVGIIKIPSIIIKVNFILPLESYGLFIFIATNSSDSTTIFFSNLTGHIVFQNSYPIIVEPISIDIDQKRRDLIIGLGSGKILCFYISLAKKTGGESAFAMTLRHSNFIPRKYGKKAVQIASIDLLDMSLLITDVGSVVCVNSSTLDVIYAIEKELFSLKPNKIWVDKFGHEFIIMCKDTNTGLEMVEYWKPPNDYTCCESGEFSRVVIPISNTVLGVSIESVRCERMETAIAIVTNDKRMHLWRPLADRGAVVCEAVLELFIPTKIYDATKQITIQKMYEDKSFLSDSFFNTYDQIKGIFFFMRDSLLVPSCPLFFVASFCRSICKVAIHVPSELDEKFEKAATDLSISELKNDENVVVKSDKSKNVLADLPRNFFPGGDFDSSKEKMKQSWMNPSLKKQMTSRKISTPLILRLESDDEQSKMSETLQSLVSKMDEKYNFERVGVLDVDIDLNESRIPSPEDMHILMPLDNYLSSEQNKEIVIPDVNDELSIDLEDFELAASQNENILAGSKTRNPLRNAKHSFNTSVSYFKPLHTIKCKDITASPSFHHSSSIQLVLPFGILAITEVTTEKKQISKKTVNSYRNNSSLFLFTRNGFQDVYKFGSSSTNSLLDIMKISFSYYSGLIAAVTSLREFYIFNLRSTAQKQPTPVRVEFGSVKVSCVLFSDILLKKPRLTQNSSSKTTKGSKPIPVSQRKEHNDVYGTYSLLIVGDNDGILHFAISTDTGIVFMDKFNAHNVGIITVLTTGDSFRPLWRVGMELSDNGSYIPITTPGSAIITFSKDGEVKIWQPIFNKTGKLNANSIEKDFLSYSIKWRMAGLFMVTPSPNLKKTDLMKHIETASIDPTCMNVLIGYKNGAMDLWHIPGLVDDGSGSLTTSHQPMWSSQYHHDSILHANIWIQSSDSSIKDVDIGLDNDKRHDIIAELSAYIRGKMSITVGYTLKDLRHFCDHASLTTSSKDKSIIIWNFTISRTLSEMTSSTYLIPMPCRKFSFSSVPLHGICYCASFNAENIKIDNRFWKVTVISNGALVSVYEDVKKKVFSGHHSFVSERESTSTAVTSSSNPIFDDASVEASQASLNNNEFDIHQSIYTFPIKCKVEKPSKLVNALMNNLTNTAEVVLTSWDKLDKWSLVVKDVNPMIAAVAMDSTNHKIDETPKKDKVAVPAAIKEVKKTSLNFGHKSDETEDRVKSADGKKKVAFKNIRMSVNETEVTETMKVMGEDTISKKKYVLEKPKVEILVPSKLNSISRENYDNPLPAPMISNNTFVFPSPRTELEILLPTELSIITDNSSLDKSNHSTNIKTDSIQSSIINDRDDVSIDIVDVNITPQSTENVEKKISPSKDEESGSVKSTRSRSSSIRSVIVPVTNKFDGGVLKIDGDVHKVEAGSLQFDDEVINETEKINTPNSKTIDDDSLNDELSTVESIKEVINGTLRRKKFGFQKVLTWSIEKDDNTPDITPYVILKSKSPPGSPKSSRATTPKSPHEESNVSNIKFVLEKKYIAESIIRRDGRGGSSSFTFDIGLPKSDTKNKQDGEILTKVTHGDPIFIERPKPVKHKLISKRLETPSDDDLLSGLSEEERLLFESLDDESKQKMLEQLKKLKSNKLKGTSTAMAALMKNLLGNIPMDIEVKFLDHSDTCLLLSLFSKKGGKVVVIVTDNTQSDKFRIEQMLSVDKIKEIDGFLQYHHKEIRPYQPLEILIKDLFASTEYNIHVTENILKNDGKLNMTDEINETNIAVSTSEESPEFEWHKMAEILQWIEISAAIKSISVINSATNNDPIIPMPTQDEINDHFRIENGEPVVELVKGKRTGNKIVLQFVEWWIGPRPLFITSPARSRFLLNETLLAAQQGEIIQNSISQGVLTPEEVEILQKYSSDFLELLKSDKMNTLKRSDAEFRKFRLWYKGSISAREKTGGSTSVRSTKSVESNVTPFAIEMRKNFLQGRIDEVNQCSDQIKILVEGYSFFVANSLTINDLSDKITTITKNEINSIMRTKKLSALCIMNNIVTEEDGIKSIDISLFGTDNYSYQLVSGCDIFKYCNPLSLKPDDPPVMKRACLPGTNRKPIKPWQSSSESEQILEITLACTMDSILELAILDDILVPDPEDAVLPTGQFLHRDEIWNNFFSWYSGHENIDAVPGRGVPTLARVIFSEQFEEKFVTDDKFVAVTMKALKLPLPDSFNDGSSEKLSSEPNKFKTLMEAYEDCISSSHGSFLRPLILIRNMSVIIQCRRISMLRSVWPPGSNRTGRQFIFPKASILTPKFEIPARRIKPFLSRSIEAYTLSEMINWGTDNDSDDARLMKAEAGGMKLRLYHEWLSKEKDRVAESRIMMLAEDERGWMMRQTVIYIERSFQNRIDKFEMELKPKVDEDGYEIEDANQSDQIVFQFQDSLPKEYWFFFEQSIEFKHGSGIHNEDELEDLILQEKEIARKALEAERAYENRLVEDRKRLEQEEINRHKKEELEKRLQEGVARRRKNREMFEELKKAKQEAIEEARIKKEIEDYHKQLLKEEQERLLQFQMIVEKERDRVEKENNLMYYEDYYALELRSRVKEINLMQHEDIISFVRDQNEKIEEELIQRKIKKISTVYVPFEPFQFKKSRVKLPVLESLLQEEYAALDDFYEKTNDDIISKAGSHQSSRSDTKSKTGKYSTLYHDINDESHSKLNDFHQYLEEEKLEVELSVREDKNSPKADFVRLKDLQYDTDKARYPVDWKISGEISPQFFVNLNNVILKKVPGINNKKSSTKIYPALSPLKEASSIQFTEKGLKHKPINSLENILSSSMPILSPYTKSNINRSKSMLSVDYDDNEDCKIDKIVPPIHPSPLEFVSSTTNEQKDWMQFLQKQKKLSSASYSSISLKEKNNEKYKKIVAGKEEIAFKKELLEYGIKPVESLLDQKTLRLAKEASESVKRIIEEKELLQQYVGGNAFLEDKYYLLACKPGFKTKTIIESNPKAMELSDQIKRETFVKDLTSGNYNKYLNSKETSNGDNENSLKAKPLKKKMNAPKVLSILPRLNSPYNQTKTINMIRGIRINSEENSLATRSLPSKSNSFLSIQQQDSFYGDDNIKKRNSLIVNMSSATFNHDEASISLDSQGLHLKYDPNASTHSIDSDHINDII